MSTFLFDKTIFGPVISRRLGVSLGINLMPNDRKVCSFDCLYCECGFNQRGLNSGRLPSKQAVSDELEAKLIEMQQAQQLPDVITFAGNGEPTLHPDFEHVIDEVIALRNRYAPSAKIAVLSNASRLHVDSVRRALNKVDDNILKLDGGFEETINVLDRPNYNYNIAQTVASIAAFAENLVVQTMFVRWRDEKTGVVHDNSTSGEVEAWLELLQQIRPPRLMIYTIARDTPLSGMEKITPSRLDEIADLARSVVPDVQVSY